MASFDPKSFSRNEWGIVGGVFVAFIFLFFESFGVSASFAGRSVSDGVSGWHWAGLWVPVIFLAIPAAAIVALRALRNDLIPASIPVGTRVVVAGALIIALIIQVIRALTYPSADFGELGGAHISYGASYGTYLVCIAMAVATGFAVLDFKESGEALPKLPAKPATTTPASAESEPSEPSTP